MSLRGRTRTGLGKVESYLPSPAKAPPAGPGWFHAIEHDGFRTLAPLAKLLRGSPLRVVLDETFEEDGAIVCRGACRLGCEGIVSKRLGSRYRSGRSAHWVKVKNPKAPAVKREAEEDWGVASHRREET
jgi:hypothetical protein